MSFIQFSRFFAFENFEVKTNIWWALRKYISRDKYFLNFCFKIHISYILNIKGKNVHFLQIISKNCTCKCFIGQNNIPFKHLSKKKSHMGKITCGENWCQKRPSGMFPARQKKEVLTLCNILLDFMRLYSYNWLPGPKIQQNT